MIVKSIITLFTVFSFIYLLFGWFSGEKQTICIKWFSFSSIRHSLAIFGFIFSLSLIICCICYFYFNYVTYYYTGYLWDCSIIATVLLPFSNFFVFFFKTKRKAKSIKLHINSQSNSINEIYSSIKTKITELKAVNSVANQITFPVNGSQSVTIIKSYKLNSDIVKTNQHPKKNKNKYRQL